MKLSIVVPSSVEVCSVQVESCHESFFEIVRDARELCISEIDRYEIWKILDAFRKSGKSDIFIEIDRICPSEFAEGFGEANEGVSLQAESGLIGNRVAGTASCCW